MDYLCRSVDTRAKGYLNKYMAYVYRHIRLDKNEPFYIGIGSCLNRCYIKTRRNKHWHSITDKTDYRVDIIFDDLSLEDAKEKEKELIYLYGKKVNGGTFYGYSLPK